MKNIKLLLLIMILLILAWSPWLSKDEAIAHVKKNPNFIDQHRQFEELPPINIFKIPFGYYITTIEGVWIVPFWNGIK